MAVSYQDWRGRVAEVSDQTLVAVLDALGNSRPCPPAGQREIGGARAPWPARRSWGFAVQLYSVRSLGSWGHGDLRDLADLAAWSGRELGADFVLVNPLHAPDDQRGLFIAGKVCTYSQCLIRSCLCFVVFHVGQD